MYDGSCNLILEAFYKALESEGVRAQSPKRKYTGGVCELAAVRDFLARKITRVQTEKIKANNFAPVNDSKRQQRLNKKRTKVSAG